MVTNSRYSSNKSSYFTINLLLSIRANSETRALHKFTSSSITASIPYVRENKVSPVNLLGVVRYAHRMLGNSSAHLPLIPFNLLFNPFYYVSLHKLLNIHIPNISQCLSLRPLSDDDNSSPSSQCTRHTIRKYLSRVDFYMTNYLHLLLWGKLCNETDENLTFHQTSRFIPNVKRAQPSFPLGDSAREIISLQQ